MNASVSVRVSVSTAVTEDPDDWNVLRVQEYRMTGSTSPHRIRFLVAVAVAVAVAGIGILAGCTHTYDQAADQQFAPPIALPAFPAGKGPVVMLDEAHYNFHTASGRYLAFAQLLRRDGYVVQSSVARFTSESLAAGQVLVIANALHESNQEEWSPPNPSAFTSEEIDAVHRWVSNGGSLFLIADHLPFPGAAGDLAKRFGIRFNNGYGMEPGAPPGPLVFSAERGALLQHPVVQGRSADEKVDAVATFGGSAFEIESGAPLLRFSDKAMAMMPTVFGQPFDAATPRMPIGGWLQGAVIRVGSGRVAVFGEAAMFSAQLAGPDQLPMGMNAAIARQNPQFLLNVVHWLSGLLDSGTRSAKQGDQ